MNRILQGTVERTRSIPHASGDEPYNILGIIRYSKSIPHASGDEPRRRRRTFEPQGVYPTRVGMNRNKTVNYKRLFCIPHASGDEPSRLLLPPAAV